MQLQFGYQFQFSHRNFFGKYVYSEAYRNGAFAGLYKEHLQSTQFRDNFYTLTAGFVYTF
jgi:hypothetical protein